MNISLYKNRLFLLTVFKQLEKSLQILNKYIDQYILCILLFSIQHYPSNSIQHTLALLRVTTKFFYQALWIGWKVSSENFFRLLKPFPKREESQHISRKHDVCGMSELNVYSLRSLRNLQSCENVNFLPNLVSNDCSLPALLFTIEKNITQSPQKILPLFVFSLAVEFSEVNVVLVTKAGVSYITLTQKFYPPNLFIFI